MGNPLILLLVMDLLPDALRGGVGATTRFLPTAAVVVRVCPGTALGVDLAGAGEVLVFTFLPVISPLVAFSPCRLLVLDLFSLIFPLLDTPRSPFPEGFILGLLGFSTFFVCTRWA
jgi:hypothetical protein